MTYRNEGDNKYKAQFTFNQIYMRHERLLLPSCYKFYSENDYKEKAEAMESFMEGIPR